MDNDRARPFGLTFDDGPLLSPEPDKLRPSPLPTFSASAFALRPGPRTTDASLGSSPPFPPSQPLFHQFEQQGPTQGDPNGSRAQPPSQAQPAPAQTPLLSQRHSPLYHSNAEQASDINPAQLLSAGTLLSYLFESGALIGVMVQNAQGLPRLVDGILSLQVDLSHLLNANPDLGAQLLMEPKTALWELMDELHEKGISASPCPRIWLRPTKVPLPCQPVDALLACLTLPGSATNCPSSSGLPQPVCCYGVVSAAASLTAEPYSRVWVCPRCDTSREVLEGRGVRADGSQHGTLCERCAAALEEELSMRVMINRQDLWLAPLSAAGLESGETNYHARLGCVRLTVVDELAGVAKVGDVVRVVGMARLIAPPPPTGRAATAAAGTATGHFATSHLRTAATSTAEVEVEVLSLTHMSPYSLWVRPGAGTTATAAITSTVSIGNGGKAEGDDTTAGFSGGAATGGLVLSSGRPLQVLCDLLTRLMKQPIHIHVKLALLISAVCSGPGGGGGGGRDSGGGGNSGGRSSGGSQRPAMSGAGSVLGGGGEAGATAGGPRQQLSILFACASLDPYGPRMLHGAASLLCPHSAVLGPAACGGGLVEDPLVPRLSTAGGRMDGEGQAGGVAHGSVMLAAGNSGVVVVEAEHMTNRQKTALCDLLSRPAVVLAPGKHELTVPTSLTTWVAASRQSGGAGTGGRRGGGGGVAGPVPGSHRGGWGGLDDSRFDLVLDAELDDNEVAEMVFELRSLPRAGGWGNNSAARHQTRQLTAYLRQLLREHLAGGALMQPPPALSERALGLLTRYYVSVRQSGVQVTQSALQALIKVATGCARLHLRNTVLETPDCLVAVLLMERTLTCRFGDSYMGLALPPLRESSRLEDGGGPEAEDEMLTLFGGGGDSRSLDAWLESMLGSLSGCLRGYMSLGWSGE